MNSVWTKQFRRDMRRLPVWLQRLALEKLGLLEVDLRHPSLRVKKMQGGADRYEGSINMNYRFTFLIEGDDIILLRVGTHKILDEV